MPDTHPGILVIDASVAVKWFVDEAGSEEARAVLLALRDQPHRFVVPELFFIEMLSVLARIAEGEAQLKDLLGILEELGIARLALGHETLQRAAELSFSYGMSAYDAVYAATAELVQGKWLTADSRAHARIASLGISSLMGS